MGLSIQVAPPQPAQPDPTAQPDPHARALFQFLFLSEVLQWRAQTTPDHVLYTLLNCRVRRGAGLPWLLASRGLAWFLGALLLLSLNPFASVLCEFFLCFAILTKTFVPRDCF